MSRQTLTLTMEMPIKTVTGGVALAEVLEPKTGCYSARHTQYGEPTSTSDRPATAFDPSILASCIVLTIPRAVSREDGSSRDFSPAHCAARTVSRVLY